jgi:hypothetical protein
LEAGLLERCSPEELGRSDFRVTVPALDEMEIVKANYFAG